MNSIDEPRTRWTFASIIPGMMYFPATFTSRAPAGIVTRPRGPIDRILRLSTTMTPSFTGAAPVPLISVAPTIAVTGSAAAAPWQTRKTASATRMTLISNSLPIGVAWRVRPRVGFQLRAPRQLSVHFEFQQAVEAGVVFRPDRHQFRFAHHLRIEPHPVTSSFEKSQPAAPPACGPSASTMTALGSPAPPTGVARTRIGA